jgi:hypothetical protein
MTTPTEPARCDICGAHEVTLSIREQPFLYGACTERVILKAMVPVFNCAVCKGMYCGPGAEEAREAAVDGHLRKVP